MNGLSSFPSPPCVGHVTVQEKNGEFLSVPGNTSGEFKHSEFPDIDVLEDLSKPVMSKETAKSAFLEHRETQSKRIKRAWYEHGLMGVLEEVANSAQSREPTLVGRVACTVLGSLRWANSFHASVFPHYSMSSEDIASEFSPNPQWREGSIRCLAWHPHTHKQAVCLWDDSVRVYSACRQGLVPVLKHSLQKHVTHLAWRPNSASELAVACQTCILIWTIEPMSLATRPSTSCARVLSAPGHSPVTSLDWDPSGRLLVSGSATSTAMMVWDVSGGSHVALSRWGGGGVSLVKFSPEGGGLVAACPASTFRIWECSTWHCDIWSKITSRVRTVCWSPNGGILLFATDQPIIFSVLLYNSLQKEAANQISSNNRAIEVADVTCTELRGQDGESVIVGGSVQSIAWDQTGERLAVMFSGAGQDLIAVYQTRCRPELELLPCGFVRGEKGETPLLLSFHPHFTRGALLTVAWSSGRVSHTPMFFTARGEILERARAGAELQLPAGVVNNLTATFNGGHSVNASLYTSFNNEA